MDQSQDEEDIESVATDELIELMERALLPQLGSEGLSNFLQQTISDSLRRQSPPNLLVLAVSSCDGDEVDRLLRKGVDVDAMDGALESPLYVAARCGYSQILTRLLQAGANVNQPCMLDHVPLHAAVNGGHREIVSLLLDGGANPDARDVKGWTPLHVACCKGQDQLVEILLQYRADPRARDFEGWSVLHVAVDYGRTDVLRRLCAAGADINVVDHYGRVPLHTAAMTRPFPTLVPLLLELGADPNVPDGEGVTPLRFAVETPEYANEAVPALLQRGAHVGTRDNKGRSPLHSAISDPTNGLSEASLRMLISHAADIDEVVTINGEPLTPLLMAIKGRHPLAVRLLLEHPINLERPGEKKMNPLHFAVMYRNIDITRMLLQAGASVNARGGGGITALHLAALKGDEACATTLLNHGASVDARDEAAQTPLHIAIKYRNVEVAKLLLEAGADANSRDDKGRSPLHIAVDEADELCIALLLKHRANVTAKDWRLYTPRHIVQEKIREEFNLGDQDDATENENADGDDQDWEDVSDNEESGVAELDEPSNGEDQTPRQTWLRIAELLMEAEAEQDPLTERLSPSPRPAGWCSNLIKTRILCAQREYSPPAEQPIIERESTPKAGILSPNQESSGLVKTGALGTEMESCEPMRAESRGDKANVGLIDDENEEEEETSLNVDEEAGQGVMGFRVGAVLVLNYVHDYLNMHRNSVTPEGYRRFEWTCAVCQRTFREVVRERSPGAVEAWVKLMNGGQPVAVGNPLSSGSAPSTGATTSNASTAPPQNNNTMAGGSTAGGSTPKTTVTSPTGVNTSSVEPEFLMLCIPESRGTTRLVCNDLSERRTDEEVFTGLKEQYNSRRWWSWARISAISHIEWKQFHIYHSDRVAISAHQGEDWPTCERPHCTTGCSHAVEYSYAPAPAPLDPPIPRAAMMHFFHNPSHAGTKTFHRASMPKRKDRLKLRPNDNIREGWGLVFKERVCWTKVAVTEGLIGMVSLIFAVTWSKTHGGNVQDAFAPSSWLLALGAVVLTLIYQYEQAG